MKGAPDFKEWPDAVSGMWKIELLRWLGSITGIKILVETGTCEGVTPWNLQNDFDRIYTVELHKGLFESAAKRLSEIKNVYQCFGDSREFLRNFFEEPPTSPILFWLDAHSSGPHTADAGDPLAEEITIITQNCPDALIVIDDMMGLYDGRAISVPGWHREYRTGEIVMYKNGRYSIPEFES